MKKSILQGLVLLNFMQPLVAEWYDWFKFKPYFNFTAPKKINFSFMQGIADYCSKLSIKQQIGIGVGISSIFSIGTISFLRNKKNTKQPNTKQFKLNNKDVHEILKKANEIWNEQKAQNEILRFLPVNNYGLFQKGNLDNINVCIEPSAQNTIRVSDGNTNNNGIFLVLTNQEFITHYPDAFSHTDFRNYLKDSETIKNNKTQIDKFVTQGKLIVSDVTLL